MARIRTIKPEFFTNWKLYQAEKESGLPLRLAFEGLWCCADREGRFRWEPQELKLHCLPYDEVDFVAVMAALEEGDYIRSYEVAGKRFGHVPSWSDHQAINNREAGSVIPAPARDTDASARVDDASGSRHGNYSVEGKGREGKGSTEQPLAASAPVAHLPLADGSEFAVTEADIVGWRSAFPAVDVQHHLLRMREWCLSNPSRRKTRRGVRRFITEWLGREQDKGGKVVPFKPVDPFEGIVR